MMKHSLSILLCLIMVLSMLPVVGVTAVGNAQIVTKDVPDQAGHADTEGYTACGHGETVWTEWSTADALPTASGSYFLNGNVKLTDVCNVADGQEITICLNGYSITQTTAGKRGIYVSKGTLNLCDCTKSGQITGADVAASGGALIANGKNVVVNVHDITFTGNKATNGGAASIHGGAIVTMNDVTITGNTATAQGGGLYVVDSGSKLTLNNTTVTDNTTTSTNIRAAGGVHVNANNSTVLNGKVIIDGNYRGTGDDKVPSNLEVDYNRLPFDDALTADSRIGLSVYPETNTQAIKLVSDVAVSCYFSDDPAKIPSVQGQLLHLIAKPADYSAHANTQGYTDCGHGTAAWVEWPATDALPTTDGSYFLNGNVSLTDVWKVSAGQSITLCLNGYNITQTTAGKRIMEVTKGTVNLCDCTQKGKLSGADVTANGGALMANGSSAAVNVYDITFTGNKATNGGAVAIHGGAIVKLIRVSITNNTATAQGGGLYVVDAGSKVTLDSVTVTGNTTTSTSTRAAGGVHVNANDSTTLTGKVTIDGNFRGTDENRVPSNLEVDYNRLPTDNALTTDSRIGLSVYPETNTQAIRLVSKAAVACYFADDAAKATKVEGNVLHLIVKPTIIPEHANTEGYAAGGHGEVEWTAVLNTGTLPTASGHYFLAEDVVLNKAWNAGDDKQIVICLNGHSIVQRGAGQRIIRNGNSTVEICDCTAHINENGSYVAGKLTGGNTDASDAAGNAAAMLLTGGGTFRLHDGIITANRTEGNGVIVVQLGSTFEMCGGAITDNYAGKQGGAVYLSKSTMKMTGGIIADNEAVGSGGAIYVYGSTFLMEDGKISKNTSTTGGGGGIALKNVSDAVPAEVTVSGGEISGNVAKLDGSGVRMDSGKFTLAGGEIKGNGRDGGSAGALRLGGGAALISGGKITGNIGSNAAAVFTSCELTMTGGEISDNIGTGNGPGVYVSAAKFTMTGGKIADNEAGGNGGGVYLAQAEMEMTGGEISGNRGGMGGGIYNYGGSLTIKDGLIQNNEGYKLGGGGVYSNNRFESDNTTVKAEASLVIEGGVFTGNISKTDGAGIRADSGKFKMTGGEISGNTAGGAAGGVSLKNIQGCEISGGKVTKNKAGNAAGLYFTLGTLTVSGGEFSYNEGTGNGAGLMVTSSEMEFSGGVIKHNTAKGDGAGLYVSNATLKLCGGQVLYNRAQKMCGGLLAAKESKIYFSSGSIGGNTAKSSAGGMLIQTKSTLEMTGGDLSNNKTERHGGGLYVNKDSSAIMSGGLICGNTTEKSGAGIYVGEKAYMILAGGTIRDNHSTTQGGGLVAAGKVNMTGGIIEKNTAKLYGGGVYITNVTMTFSGGTIKENYCVDGGGMCVRGETGVLKMSGNAKVLDNKCEKSGGGILVQGKGSLFVDGGEICGNFAPNGGGGIRLHQCPAEIRNAKINNNISNGLGGGIYSNLSLILKDSELCDNKIVKDNKINVGRSSAAVYSHNDSKLEMENVILSGNTSAGIGGAMEVAYDADAIVKNCTFTNNTAAEEGGAIYVYWEGQLYMYDCTFEGNSAPEGGVVGTDVYAEMEFHNCTIRNNQADAGGVAYLNVRARAVFDGCTIENNVSEKNASVVWANGDVVLKDTVVTGNRDKGGVAAIYLTNMNADTESYIPGVYEIMGNTVVQNNEGGDMVLEDKAFINIPGDGLGADAKIQLKLHDPDITRWIIGPYNYVTSGNRFLLTQGEQSLSEAYTAAPGGEEETQPNDTEPSTEPSTEPVEQPAGNGTLVGLIAIVVALVAACVAVVIVRMRTKKQS